MNQNNEKKPDAQTKNKVNEKSTNTHPEKKNKYKSFSHTGQMKLLFTFAQLIAGL